MGLTRLMTCAAVASFVLATAGVLAPGGLGHAASTGAVASVTVTPLARVTWLVFRWTRERDLRFVAIGGALLALVALVALIAVAA